MAGKPRPCVHCGAIFRPEFPRGAARTCSPECAKERKRATVRAANRASFQRDPEKWRKKSREYGRANPEKRRAKWNAWAKRNREHHNATNRARYAARKAKR